MLREEIYTFNFPSLMECSPFVNSVYTGIWCVHEKLISFKTDCPFYIVKETVTFKCFSVHESDPQLY